MRQPYKIVKSQLKIKIGFSYAFPERFKMLEKIIRTIALPIAPISGLIKLLDFQYNTPKPWKERNDVFKRVEKTTRNAIANTLMFGFCIAVYTMIEMNRFVKETLEDYHRSLENLSEEELKAFVSSMQFYSGYDI